MTIFRGPGGTGSATSDADTTEFQEFLDQTEAARDIAVNAQTSATVSQNSASSSASSAATSASSAATSASNASTSASSASTSAANAAASAALASDNTFGVGFRNRTINGNMRIDQRNNGASVATTSTGTNVYTIDRWLYNVSAASKFTLQQNAAAITPPSGFSNYLGCTSTSAYSVGAAEQFLVGQFIEGLNFSDLAWGTAAAQAVTLSFWVRSSLTGTFGGSVVNNAFDRNYPFSYTVSAANTWEQKTVTITGDTTGSWLATSGIGARLYFSLGAGASSSGTAGAWASGGKFSATGATSVVGTNGATFYITGVQLEAGTLATPFERRDYGRELMLCQRYYAKQRVFIGDTYQANEGNVSGSTYVGFKVSMRSAPTILFVNNSAVLTNADVATFISPDGFSYAVNITGNGTYNRDSTATIEIEL